MNVFYGNHKPEFMPTDFDVYYTPVSDNNSKSVLEVIAKLKSPKAKSNQKTIIVARHGKPALNRKVWLSSDEYVDWWQKYDEGGLIPEQNVPRKLLNAVAHSEVIVASPLKRAVETAERVAGDRRFMLDEVFVEAPLPPPQLPKFIKLTPRMWGFVARCTWYIGFNGNSESHDEAKIRAKNAADKLVSLNYESGTVSLLAHGWFNRMMRPHLKAHGYECVYDGGDFHWSYRIYQKDA